MGFMRQLQEYEKTLPKKNVEETKIAKASEHSSRSIVHETKAAAVSFSDIKTGPSSPSSKQMMFAQKNVPTQDK